MINVLLTGQMIASVGVSPGISVGGQNTRNSGEFSLRVVQSVALIFVAFSFFMLVSFLLRSKLVGPASCKLSIDKKQLTQLWRNVKSLVGSYIIG